MAKARLLQRYPVRRLALFGSYARGDQHPGSDVDILVDVDPSIGLAFTDLADELAAILDERVDVVSRRAISRRHWQLIAPEAIDVE